MPKNYKVPEYVWNTSIFGPDVLAVDAGGGALGNGVWPTANKALYIPVRFPVSVTLTEIAFFAANGTGNYDLGLYDDTYQPIARSGSTAMTAAGTKTLAISSYRAKAATNYWCALALSSTSGQVLRWLASGSDARFVLPTGVMMETSALPLPSAMTGVTPVDALIPIMRLQVAGWT